MLVNKQNILTTSKNLILIAVAALGLIYLAQSTKNTASEHFQIEKQPQEYMTHILIKSYTKEGTLKSIMNAERWAYLPETESSTLTLPHLTLYKADGSVWILNANEGHIQQSTIGKIGIVQLLHDVKTHYVGARKDSTKPLDIHSTMAEFDDKQGTATYQGNVVMNQGDSHLTSDTLKLKRDSSGKMEHIIATGTPARFKSITNEDQSPIEGHAKNLSYFPKQDKILFLNAAELTQNKATIRGETLVYFLNTHVLSAVHAPGKRTTVILPGKNENDE